MGLLIACTDERARYPRPLRLTLTCDGHGEDLDLFGGTLQHFEHPDGFVGAYRLAMNAGWKDTSASGTRMFLGPCCSGK